MSTLTRAIEIAAKAHAKQPPDKGGTPYILHPLHVMLTLPLSRDRSVNEQYARMAAVMHDVLEDAADQFSVESLRNEGFPEEVLDALLALTKTKDEPRESAARRAAANPIARLVKLADVAHNMDISRVPEEMRDDKFMSIQRQYKVVLEILEQSLPQYPPLAAEANHGS